MPGTDKFQLCDSFTVDEFERLTVSDVGNVSLFDERPLMTRHEHVEHIAEVENHEGCSGPGDVVWDVVLISATEHPQESVSAEDPHGCIDAHQRLRLQRSDGVI